MPNDLQTRHSCLATKRILVAEDTFLVADELAHHLSSAGAQVIGPYPTCAAALNSLLLHQVDAAILDIKLADESCYPLALRLVELGVPFVFYTGYTQQNVRQDFAHVIYVGKPTPSDALLAALEKLLEQGAA